MADRSSTPAHPDSPDNPERITGYQRSYRLTLDGYGYHDSPERRAFLKLMEGKEYGHGPLMSAWAWFCDGWESATPSEGK